MKSQLKDVYVVEPAYIQSEWNPALGIPVVLCDGSGTGPVYQLSRRHHVSGSLQTLQQQESNTQNYTHKSSRAKRRIQAYKTPTMSDSSSDDQTTKLSVKTKRTLAKQRKAKLQRFKRMLQEDTPPTDSFASVVKASYKVVMCFEKVRHAAPVVCMPSKYPLEKKITKTVFY